MTTNGESFSREIAVISIVRRGDKAGDRLTWGR